MLQKQRIYTERIEQGDELAVNGLTEAISSLDSVTVSNVTRGFEFRCDVKLSPRQRRILAAGGLLNYTRDNG